MIQRRGREVTDYENRQKSLLNKCWQVNFVSTGNRLRNHSDQSVT